MFPSEKLWSQVKKKKKKKLMKNLFLLSLKTLSPSIRLNRFYEEIPLFNIKFLYTMGFPDGSDGKKSAFNAGDLGSIAGLVRCSGEGNGNPLQYSCLENSMNRGVWGATVHGGCRVGHDWLTKHIYITCSILLAYFYVSFS